MKSLQQLSFLNFLIILLNFGWILFIDHQKFYGLSIHEIFNYNWTYLTPHHQTFSIWYIIALVMTASSFLYFIMITDKEIGINIARKVKNVNMLIIINQVALGISMVAKVNGYVSFAFLMSITVFITLLMISKKLEVCKYKDINTIEYLTRVALSIYTGWMIFLLGFNGLDVIVKNFTISYKTQSFIALTFLLISYFSVVYFTIKYKIAPLLISYLAGVIGSYAFILNFPSTIYIEIFLTVYKIIISLSVLLLFVMLIFNKKLYRKKELLDTPNFN